jgi:lipoate-protein ligase A
VISPSWKLLPSSFIPPQGQMELDRELFKAYQPGDKPLLRFFQFSKPTFTLGRLESRRVDLARLSHPYEIRPTGGWTVLHGREDLCYSIIASTRDPWVGGDLPTSYQKISVLLKDAFRQLGRAVELSQAPHRSQGLAHCFSAPSKCELTLGGLKVSGGAQAREAGVFLQQGAILLSVSDDWRKAFASDTLEAMTGLNDGPFSSVTAAQVEGAVTASFERAGIVFEKILTPFRASVKL